MRLKFVCGWVGNARHASVETFSLAFRASLEKSTGARVMCRDHEEADGHGRISLVETGVGAFEELLQRDEVAQTLAHLLSVDGEHVVVHPVVYHLVAWLCHSLCYLAFVMREDESMPPPWMSKWLPRYLRPIAVHSQCHPKESVAPGTGPSA